MKKKRNLLTIISSILGCIAICGFSMFGLFSRSIEKSFETKADTSLYSSSYDFSHNYTIYKQNNIQTTRDVNLNLQGNILYYQSLVNGVYTYNASISVSPSLIEGSNVANFETFDVTSITLVSNDLPNALISREFKFDLQGFYTEQSDVTYKYFLYLQFKFYVGEVEYSLSNSSIGFYFIWEYTPYPDTSRYLTRSDTQRVFDLTFTPSDTQTAYTTGYQDGYQAGYDVGQNDGYQSGVSAGNSAGYETGYQAGVDSQQSVIASSYQSGYADGYNEGQTQDSTVATIFSGILQVAMVPVNFFLSVFNFEILGINLSSFIQALFTIALTIIVLKTVIGKGGGSSDN